MGVVPLRRNRLAVRLFRCGIGPDEVLFSYMRMSTGGLFHKWGYLEYPHRREAYESGHDHPPEENDESIVVG